MEAKDTPDGRIPAAIKGHRHFSYGGAVVPENVTIQQPYDITPTMKSNVRLNDQLVPKPTDINIGERMIKVAIPKEHPYTSHISRFAMFPAFHSADDPVSGVRAASRPTLGALVPSSAPGLTVLSKTIGGPYRHEVLEAPLSVRDTAVEWPGERGFLDYTKPLKGQGQVFYPSPPKTVFPNSRLRNWDISLSDRTANAQKNVEKSHWITSYQLHYTGSGPANPLKMDDYDDNIIDSSAAGGMSPHATPLRERSQPVFVTSQPREGRRTGRHRGHHSASRAVSQLSTEPTAQPVQVQGPNHRLAPAAALHPTPPTITTTNTKPTSVKELIEPQEAKAVFSRSLTEPGSAEDVNNVAGNTRQPGARASALRSARSALSAVSKRGEHYRVKFDDGHLEGTQPPSPNSRGTKGGRTEPSQTITDTERQVAASHSHPRPQTPHTATVEVDEHRAVVAELDTSHAQPQDSNVGSGSFSPPPGRSLSVTDKSAVGGVESSRAAHFEQRTTPRDRETTLARSVSSAPCMLPRPPVLPGIIHPASGGPPQGGLRFSSLVELQDSFSKSEARRNFNNACSSVAGVDLRDNIHTGKKHQFYGINCYYLHG